MDETRDRTVASFSIAHMWEEHGIAYKPIVMVTFALATGQAKTYEDALDAWTQYAKEKYEIDQDAKRWHTEICWYLLDAECEPEEGVAAWFERQAAEVAAKADDLRRELGYED